MSNSYEYKPPLGFDIRVKKGTDKKPKPRERRCERPGCERMAVCQVPVAPDRLNQKIWLCQDHARAHNQSWDYFQGMSESEIASYQATEHTGHRPTWAMGVNGYARDAAAAEVRRRSFRPGLDKPGRQAHTGTGGQGDPFNLFKGEDGTTPPPRESRRPLSRLQRGALDDLGLDEQADMAAVKSRYKDLVKRFHPDANGGDRGAEESLSRVIRAYQTLRASGFK